MRPAAAAGLDAEQELAVEKLLALVVQEQRIDAVPEREVHRRGNEHVEPAVGVEVADARPPRPVVFGADAVRNLLELAGAGIPVERVAEDERALRASQKRLGPLHGRLRLL